MRLKNLNASLWTASVYDDEENGPWWTHTSFPTGTLAAPAFFDTIPFLKAEGNSRQPPPPPHRPRPIPPPIIRALKAERFGQIR